MKLPASPKVHSDTESLLAARCRDRTATVDVANGFAQVLPVIFMCLLRTQEGAKVWEATSRSCAGNDEGLSMEQESSPVQDAAGQLHGSPFLILIICPQSLENSKQYHAIPSCQNLLSHMIKHTILDDVSTCFSPLLPALFLCAYVFSGVIRRDQGISPLMSQ